MKIKEKFLIGTITAMADKEVGNIAKKLQRNMSTEIHVQSGALKDSLDSQRAKVSKYRVGVNTSRLISDPRNMYGTDYSPYYYFGSKPHTIRAKNGGKLRFLGANGKYVYRSQVRHPGYEGDDFIKRAINKTK